MLNLNSFKDRTHAGQLLAQELRQYTADQSAIVLALPRGGVPVAFTIAQTLHVPLDILLVRKLGMPGHEEFAIGAIASGGLRVLQEDVIRDYGISEAMVDAITAHESQELERRENLYRGGREAPDLRGRKVILVDDGLATGATMTAAIKTVRAARPVRLIVAVPVGAPDTVAKLTPDVDQMVCLLQPERFYAVGLWYQHFGQTSDDEVIRLLAQAQQFVEPNKSAQNA